MEEHNLLSKQDIEKLFVKSETTPKSHHKKVFHHKIIREIVEWLILLLVVFVIGFIIINWQSIYLKIKYLYSTNIKKQVFSSQEISSPAFFPDENTNGNTSTQNAVKVAYLPENRLYIDKINLDVPIIWNVPENQIIDQLKNGVAHYQGTSLPDQSVGNVFITGHSSGYIWSKDLYNQAFALLDELKNGDKIALIYQNKKYTYEVYDKITVNPDQLEVLESSATDRILSLMTCVPIGTNLKRLVIKAKYVVDQEIEAPKVSPTEKSTTGATENKSTDENPIEVKPTAPAQTNIPDLTKNPPALLFLPDVP